MSLEWILKRLQFQDFDVLGYLKEFGAMDKRKLKRRMQKMFGLDGEEVLMSVHRLKVYGLVKSIKKNTGYILDLTEKGLKFLEYRQGLMGGLNS